MDETQATFGIGRIGSMPVRGGAINLDASGVEAVAKTASTLIKATALVGAGGLAAYLIRSSMYGTRQRTPPFSQIPESLGIDLSSIELPPLRSAEEVREEKKEERSVLRAQADGRISLAHFANIEGQNSEFDGVILNEVIRFTASQKPFCIPTEDVVSITNIGGFIRMPFYSVVLVDGSVFQRVEMGDAGLEVVCAAGEHVVDWEDCVYAAGVKLDELEALGERLRGAILSSRDEVVAALGEDVFARFFDSGTFEVPTDEAWYKDTLSELYADEKPEVPEGGVVDEELLAEFLADEDPDTSN